MESTTLLYAQSPTAQQIAPWFSQHLPQLDPIVRHRLIQLTTGLMESVDVRVAQIATGSAFRATPVSNATQVRRILRDPRLTVATVLDPLMQSVLAQPTTDPVYLCLDESHHTDRVRLLQIVIATDAMALPIRFFVYDPNAAWADAARRCLEAVAPLMPPTRPVIVLADRVHAGVPFLACIEALGWHYVFRLSRQTHVQTAKGWQTLASMHPRRHPTRRLTQVALWKQRSWTTNVVIHRHERAGHQPVVWYLATNLPPTKDCCVLYALRWWQERGFLLMKSAGFGWERSRVTALGRVTALLVGVACATWLLWMLGRQRDHRTGLRPPTTSPQPRRVTIFRLGVWHCRDISTGRHHTVTWIVPPFRTLTYERPIRPSPHPPDHVMQ